VKVRNQYFLVSDLDEAWEFYPLLLGPGVRKPGRLVFSPPGAEFQFYSLTPEQLTRYGFSSRAGEPWSGTCLESPDWERRLDQLQAAGARLLTPWEPLAWGGGHGCQLADPSGHRWELISSD